MWFVFWTLMIGDTTSWYSSKLGVVLILEFWLQCQKCCKNVHDFFISIHLLIHWYVHQRWFRQRFGGIRQTMLTYQQQDPLEFIPWKYLKYEKLSCVWNLHIYNHSHMSPGKSVNSLWPSGAIWRQIYVSTLAQVMACCLMAPSHYLNQCWLLITEVLQHHMKAILYWVPK